MQTREESDEIMKAICLLNEKGGVGKTTNAVTLASGLAIRGAKVLLIDSDPQAHATISLQARKRDSLVRLLAQDAQWTNENFEIKPHVWADSDNPAGALYLVPSHFNNRALPMLLEGDFLLMRDRLTEIAPHIDYVIFDTSPTPSVAHGMIYLASDYIVFPSQCEFLSMDGLSSSTGNMVKGNKNRWAQGLESIHLLGVQPTKFDPTTNNHADNLELMQGHFGHDKVWTPIHDRVVWAYSSQDGQSIFRYGMTHRNAGPAVDEAWSMVNNTIEGLSA